MHYLLVFLLPSIIGIKIMEKLNELSRKNFLIYYLLLVLFSNFICSLVIIILNNFDGNLCAYINEHLKFAFKYTSLSIVVNTVLAFILGIFIKNFDISLEALNKEKKNEKSKKRI